MPIEINAEFWPMAAGCIGLAKLYPDGELSITQNGILLQEEILDTLAERYIRGLIESSSVVKRDVKRWEWYANQALKTPEKTKQHAAELRKRMNEQHKKLVKYFPEAEETNKLAHLLDELKEYDTPEDAPKVSEAIERYQQIVSTPLINEKLTLNLVKSETLGKAFFGQTSFLQKTFFQKTTEEHVAQLQKDFIDPAKLELQLYAKRRNGSKEELIQFLQENSTYKPFKNLIKPLEKLSSIQEIEDYFYHETLSCSFFHGMLATRSFEEMVFGPLAFTKQVANFTWDFQNDIPVPISALARLILFLSPLGMAFYPKRVGNENASDYLRYGGLILSQKPFAEVVKDNLRYQKLRLDGTSFSESLVGILQESLDKVKKFQQSFLIIEMHSDIDKKKTLLDYQHMPPYLVKYLENYGNSLKLLLDRELKDAFLRSVLKGIDPKSTVYEYVRKAIKEPFHADGAFFAARERKRVLLAKGGEWNMGEFDKTISLINYRGAVLRIAMVNGRPEAKEGEVYRASGRKKLESIAYRLLNAAKAGNKSDFMDTIFRVHMAANLDVPSVFVEAYKEKGLDFDTIATAFIAGMLGEGKKHNEGEDKQNG
ncbi:hypothetical protein [Bacillus massilinigeriensis]|uniref:hypothetical protein n=1 Tax=Bacillus mediterraneensis TaxID=1805474 RepID=UPI0008F809BF|nr:hypothetical protein [Bacillus mediterraneensis]